MFSGSEKNICMEKLFLLNAKYLLGYTINFNKHACVIQWTVLIILGQKPTLIKDKLYRLVLATGNK